MTIHRQKNNKNNYGTITKTKVLLNLFISFCIIHHHWLFMSITVESYYVPSSPVSISISRIMRTRIRTKSGSTAILQPVKLLKKNMEEDEIVCGDRIIGDKVVQVEPSSSFSSDDTTVVTPSYSTRRNVLATMSSTSAAAILFSSISPAVAGVAEVDKSTGSLYTPKKIMLSGGSSAARGIKINTKDDAAAAKPERLKPGQQIQNVYETRFVAYLSRFFN